MDGSDFFYTLISKETEFIMKEYSYNGQTSLHFIQVMLGCFTLVIY